MPNFSSKYAAGSGTGFIHSLIGSSKILSLTALVSKQYTSSLEKQKNAKL